MDRKIEKKKWPPRKILTFAGSAILLFIFLYVFVFANFEGRLNIERERTSISEVRFEPFQEFIHVTGQVEPIETFFLDVTNGGRVVQKYIEEGAFLNIGDPIIELENPDLTLRVMYNEAQLFQQINALRSTRLSMEQNSLLLQSQLLLIEFEIKKQKRTYERNKHLFEKDMISKFEYEESKDEYEYMINKRDLTLTTHVQDSLFRVQQIEQLERSVEQMKGNLNLIKSQLENLTIRAPISGQLTSLNAEIGQSINRGENLGRIDDVNSYKVRVQIDEHYLPRIRTGQGGEFTFANNTYRLIIEKVYVQVANGRFEVDMHFIDDIPKGIRRGQTVHLRLELGELTEALTVAQGGFFQKTGGQWIFVLDESENQAVKRNITLGRKNTQVYEILSGLTEGEKVITSSYDNYGDAEVLIFN
jgi:HlyD family secretion protein